MEIKTRNLRPVFFAALFLVSVPFLKAQTAGYFIEFHFIQRLVWSKDENTLRYEVVIEKKDDKEYRETLRNFTDESFIEVSLEPGKYHYRVIPYDFRNQPGDSSDWKEFEIHAAISPELYDFSPSVFYVNKNAAHELTISAKNLAPNAEIYLRHLGGASIVPIEKYIDEDGSHARLVFDNDQLIPGDYEVVAMNPGRMEKSKEGFTIVLFISDEKPQEPAKKKNDQIYMGVGMYWPDMSMSWPNKGVYWDQFSDQISFPGFMLHFRTVIYEKNFFSIDYALRLSWYNFKDDSDDYYFMYDFLSLLMQMWLPNRSIAFCIRPGFGLLFPLSHQEDSSLNAQHVNLDVSIWYALGKHFFLEIGIVGVDLLFKDDYQVYIYPPFLMLGCRF